jgi:hypothetical protein
MRFLPSNCSKTIFPPSLKIKGIRKNWGVQGRKDISFKIKGLKTTSRIYSFSSFFGGFVPFGGLSPPLHRSHRPHRCRPPGSPALLSIFLAGIVSAVREPRPHISISLSSFLCILFPRPSLRRFRLLRRFSSPSSSSSISVRVYLAAKLPA